MSAIDRIKANSDRAKVNSFLDLINEHDPALRNEVLEICAKDSEARKYYVDRYEQMKNSLHK